MGGDGEQAKNVIKEPRLLSQLKGSKDFGSSNAVQDLLKQYASGGLDSAGLLAKGGEAGQAASAQRAADRQAAIDKATAPFGGSSSALKIGPGGMGIGLQGVLNKSLSEQAAKQAGEDFDASHGSMDANGSTEELVNQLASSPLTGSRFATEQVQNSPLFGQLLGKGGALERANSEEQDLASRGYQLQPEDHEAYGQASGDIARLFGQQEQGAAQSLADRGLAAGPSGAAGVAFSGLQGNKNEMLAKAQTDIADRRMQNNMQRLNSTRQFMGQMGTLGEQAVQGQFGRNMAGIQNNYNQKAGTAQMEMGQQGQMQGQLNQGFEQEQATKGPGIGDYLGMAAGAGLGALTGGLGTAAAGAIGKGVGGLFSKKTPDFSTYDGMGNGH
jgi:hypothetical protein